MSARKTLLIALLTTLLTELLARLVLGLGNPPLFITDPTIEYLLTPSRTYRRFGNRMAINRWSMRSDDFNRHKVEPSEFRVMIFGDSIVQGGAAVDQRELATELLKADLRTKLGRPVTVGNISAGSWGPPNMLAYAQKYGFFDADVVIVVLSSHDFADVPSYEPLGPDQPTRPPASALQELVTRYLPRYLPVFAGGVETVSSTQRPPPPLSNPSVAISLAAAAELIRLARETNATVAVALHLERDERIAAPKPGHDSLAKVAIDAGASVIELGPRFDRARRAGQVPYRDAIHPNRTGHALIAATLGDWIVGKRSDEPRPE